MNEKELLLNDNDEVTVTPKSPSMNLNRHKSEPNHNNSQNDFSSYLRQVRLDQFSKGKQYNLIIRK